MVSLTSGIICYFVVILWNRQVFYVTVLQEFSRSDYLFLIVSVSFYLLLPPAAYLSITKSRTGSGLVKAKKSPEVIGLLTSG